jgi:hypothetical protein
LASADFTGDGLLDVVVVRFLFATADVFPLVILVNDGTGRFVDATATVFVGPPPAVQHPREIVIADFNGDGRPDIFIADHGDDRPPFIGFQNQLALSTPEGRLVNATANLPQQSDFTHSAAAGDIDGDGDLDLYIGNICCGSAGPQNGTGRFTVAGGALPALGDIFTGNRYTTSLFLDVDRDGNLDLVLGAEEHTTDSAILLNNGTGRFAFHPQSSAMPPKPFAPTAIALDIQSSDLNGDGFPDLLIAFTKSMPFSRGRWIQVLINNGDGTFRDETGARLPQTDNNDDWIKFLEFRDLDGDGDLDIGTRLAEGNTAPPPFYLNDGNGRFTFPPFGFESITHNLYVWLDIDGNGGRDLFTTVPGCGATCFPIERHFLSSEDLSRLANISTRGSVLTGDNVMIGGFIIQGSSPKTVLIRSRGPSMAGAPFNLPGTLANPSMQLFSGSTVIAQNDNWQDAPSCSGFTCGGAIEIAATGLDPCQPNPEQSGPPSNCALESAILITLPPGAYTAIVRGVSGGTGVGLMEVFEADAGTSSRLVNISTRGLVQTGDNVMIGGLIVQGSVPKTVLIRARGPSMGAAPFNIGGTLSNPLLRLFSGSTLIAQNDNWQDAPSCGGFACGGAATITSTGLDPCQPNPGQSTSPPGCNQESAILITLPPGAYTAIVSGADGGTGVGIVEVFEAD